LKRHPPEEIEPDAGPPFAETPYQPGCVSQFVSSMGRGWGGPADEIEDERPAPTPKKSATTYRDAVAEYLGARAGEWVSAYDIAKVGGALAWRTRLSEARRQLNMTIDNRVRTLPNGTKVSEYRASAPPSLPR